MRGWPGNPSIWKYHYCWSSKKRRDSLHASLVVKRDSELPQPNPPCHGLEGNGSNQVVFSLSSRLKDVIFTTVALSYKIKKVICLAQSVFWLRYRATHLGTRKLCSSVHQDGANKVTWTKSKPALRSSDWNTIGPSLPLNALSYRLAFSHSRFGTPVPHMHDASCAPDWLPTPST